ncbi:MAG: iron-sulfur cluster assembly accessory protein [Pseudomonadota bacterium]
MNATNAATDNAAAISMTAEALAHVRRYLAREGQPALRLDLTRTGCSGYAHEVTLADGVDAELDQAFQQDDVTLVVRRELMPLLAGTRIDFVTQGLNRVFVFDNPQAGEACGCGESFTLAEEQA